ncbi:MAG: DNA topoisomerase IV [Candidatus Marinimicrobia bacterium]|nr:DNA topoisomerase IV [Candidatus Neomarinimicrobiota bacterium]
MMSKVKYDESSIRSLDWKEHIRLRPGMYIGKLGNGSSKDDGIYILLKEIIDNSIDEYVMGYGKTIDIKVNDSRAVIRDYGRGIPIGKLVDCVSKINTGGKYDSKAFQKSVGLNGVGTKAVNALSEIFIAKTIRDGKTKEVEFHNGEIFVDNDVESTSIRNGTKIIFKPDTKIFSGFKFNPDFILEQAWNYAYLNSGLTINFNGNKVFSKNGLLDLLSKKTASEKLEYPIIHLKDKDIEIAISHGAQYGEDYYSFVNGQYTTQGGTHLAAFKEAIVKVVRDFFKKDYEANDIRSSIIASISIKIQNPVFESQTKTKLGSNDMGPKGPTVRIFINDFIKKLDDYLHKNPTTAKNLQNKILRSEKERKDMAGIKKLANKRAKKANLHNKKLRDCHYHFNNAKLTEQDRLNSCIFITEGDSASGSITKSRNVDYQAVFSLRGKPLNTFGLRKKVVYENEEFNLLQHALNIENGINGLRYNKIIIATDADVDGMHIRLLILTFFLQFFPDLIKNNHIYILDTPLFRVRNKKETIYAYSEKEKNSAIDKIGKNCEITRFKGLGEISPSEFKLFIGDQMKLIPLEKSENTSIQSTLSYFMGKNTPDRQEFIINNLRFEDNPIDG